MLQCKAGGSRCLGECYSKSDGFASSLYDPDSAFTLASYCGEKKIAYADMNLPVSLETFVGYGLEFQKRMVPKLEETEISLLKRTSAGFALQTADGQTVLAREVVLAVGITYFSYLPSFLEGLPRELVTHSSAHHDLGRFRGQTVAVVGGGASAVDIAALLLEHGADVHLVARRARIAFHKAPTGERRPLLKRITQPGSGLGNGWKSKLSCDAPLVFHRMPRNLRFRAVERHLGPAPGWFVREKVEGKVPMHLGTTIKGASVENGKIHLRFTESDGSNIELVADHLIGATGFRVAMSRLRFIDDGLRREISSIEDTPVLSSNFESSVKGLYMVGVASANSFGPLTRFAYGAKFTAQHLTRHLVRSGRAASREVSREIPASPREEAVRS